jgi:hypothetical protein
MQRDRKPPTKQRPDEPQVSGLRYKVDRDQQNHDSGKDDSMSKECAPDPRMPAGREVGL